MEDCIFHNRLQGKLGNQIIPDFLPVILHIDFKGEFIFKPVTLNQEIILNIPKLIADCHNVFFVADTIPEKSRQRLRHTGNAVTFI